jgi:hypothetical protein
MRSSRLVLLLLAASLTVRVAPATGQQPPTCGGTTPVADTVEEDWQLVVATPDPVGIGPQITTCMDPDPSTPPTFIAFDMNYVEYPAFSPGGMQVQVWSSGNVASYASQGTAQFNTPNETVTWTQHMSIRAGQVKYRIKNGQSTTWGAFGGGGTLSVNLPTTLTDMGAYDPSDSVKRSGVSWESNLVQSLTLVQVRYYANRQLISTDKTPKVVWSSSCSN